MIKYYFKIQFRRVERTLRDLGIIPWLGVLIGLTLFIGVSILLFSRIETYASYVYVFFAVNILLSFSSPKGKEFLKLSLSKSDIFKINTIQNLLIVTPFISFMAIYLEFFGVISLLVLSILTAKIEFKQSISISFKTPFSNSPFEFSRGFRKNFWVYLISYALTVIGISVGNMNLGIFSILLLGLVCGHFYSYSEPDFFVWNYNEGAKKMLFSKLKLGVVQLTFSLAPILIGLILFFPNGIGYILLAFAILVLFLFTNLLLKYAHFPRSIEVIQMVMLPIALIFFPLMLLMIPFYFHKAEEQLKSLTQ